MSTVTLRKPGVPGLARLPRRCGPRRPSGRSWRAARCSIGWCTLGRRGSRSRSRRRRSGTRSPTGRCTSPTRPGKQIALVEQAARDWVRIAAYLQRRALGLDAPACIKPPPQDRRFSDAAWQQPPFDAAYQGFLLWQQWWHEATTGIRGVAPANERIVEFTMRQFLDLFSPANSPFTHPTILRATASEHGQNLVRGFLNLVEDLQRMLAGRRPVGSEKFRARPRGRGDAGQGRLSQRIDRAPAIRADDRHGAAGAGAHRPGLDHEILHSRPLAGEFPGTPSRGQRFHRVHDLVAKPRRRATQSRNGGLPPPRHRGRARGDRRDLRRRQGARLRLLSRRHAAGDRRSADGARQRPSTRQHDPARRADGFQRGGRAHAVRQREPGRLSRGHDVGARLPRRPADGGRLPVAALQRSHLVRGGASVHAGRSAGP